MNIFQIDHRNELKAKCANESPQIYKNSFQK